MFYLKYRPQKISDLDNTLIKDTLGTTLLSNNWSHAYLFIGPRGTGKTSAARILAKIVNCRNRKKGEEPCDKCDICRDISKGNSLDVIEIDAASNTGVDDIRSLRENVRLAPTKLPYKVYIVDEVHMLSTSAFNALLKTLEEPPEHVIFVLATTDPQKLPETIVSRCLVYDFGRVTTEEIMSSLTKVAAGEKLKVEEKIIEKIAQRASGSFRDAHKLLEQLSGVSANVDMEHITALNVDNFTDEGKTLLALILAKKKKESLEKVEEFCLKNNDIKDLIGSLLKEIRDMILIESNFGNQVEIKNLATQLIWAASVMKDSPIPQLPLEMVIVEFCGLEKSEEISKGSVSQKPEAPEFWAKALESVKKQNYSLVALLRASRPGKLKDDLLTLEVFYKFHKEKLEEPKNREILEKVISDIMKKKIKVKFELSEKG